MAKKRVLKKKSILLLASLLVIILGALFVIKSGILNKKEIINKFDMFISSLEYKVKTYNLDYTDGIEIARGTQVIVYEKTVKTEQKEYNKIIYQDKEYLLDLDQVVLTKKESIKETELYVRTPLTVYFDSVSNKILGYLTKGSKVDILGFDKINIDGSINMYKIKYNDSEGYVYSKYLVNDEILSLENYNVDNTYDTHKDRKYSYDLYGGSASNVDYYPYEKPSFSDNKLLENSKSLYLNGGSTVIGNIDEYIKIAKENNMNSIVIDIKDGPLAYDSKVAKENLGNYYSHNNSLETYKNAIDKIKEADLYVIGRIVVFNDTAYAKANTSEAIFKNTGATTTWVSAYSRKAWEYNVSLAIEAVETFGFNEIQFDYVRFPESSYSMSKSKYDFKNTYNEDKVTTIQNFVFYAVDQIHKYDAYVSIDVFGECSSTYVTAYGQYWPAISNVADVISAMPYPDHFGAGQYGLSKPWTEPYKIMNAWAKTAVARQKEIPTPAIARTWIQAYNAIREPYNVYSYSEVLSQIKALKDAGLTGGYMPWNAGSSLTKYKALSKAFEINY